MLPVKLGKFNYLAILKTYPAQTVMLWSQGATQCGALRWHLRSL